MRSQAFGHLCHLNVRDELIMESWHVAGSIPPGRAQGISGYSHRDSPWLSSLGVGGVAGSAEGPFTGD